MKLWNCSSSGQLKINCIFIIYIKVGDEFDLLTLGKAFVLVVYKVFHKRIIKRRVLFPRRFSFTSAEEAITITTSIKQLIRVKLP